MLSPHTLTAAWVVPCPASEALQIASKALNEAGGRAARVDDDTSATYQFGRPVAFRMWGGWGRRGPSRLPLNADIAATELNGSSRLDLYIKNDTRGYLVEIPLVARLFDQATQLIVRSVDDSVMAHTGERLVDGWTRS